MSHSNCDISLILPAFNEARTIRTTLVQAVEYFQGRSLRYELIVAADGDDGTREISREFAKDNSGVKVIGEPVRRGKGRGVREGVKIATGSIIGFADADNKVPISEFDKIEPLLLKGFDVVTGSRALARSQIERRQPWHRRVGARGFYVFLHAFVGSPGVGDTQCGFKFFPSEIAKDLFARQEIDGYMFDVEILTLAQRLGYRVAEVPIRWRDDGDSRLELLSGNLRNVADIFRIRSSRARLSKTAPAVRVKATNG